MEWKYNDPDFECDAYNKEMLCYSPWSGHRFFGYDLICNLKPKTVVELGSFYGCSTFAFAQAVKDHNIDTEIWAVDLWETFDKFTEDDYKLDVYGEFLKVKNSCYNKGCIKELKMKFDDAATNFKDNSIDLLHIDGSHFYEDVKHDFETWKSKLKQDAIVLFHDVADVPINGQIMGSHKYWLELCEEYETTMTFEYSCGLGILFLSKDLYEETKACLCKEYYIKKNNTLDVEFKDELRKMSFIIKDNNKYIDFLKEQVANANANIEAYTTNIKANAEDYELNIDKIKKDYEKTISGKDMYIKEFEEKYREDVDKIKKDYEKTISGKDAYIRELEEKLRG